MPILHVNISAKEIDDDWLVKLKTESIPKEFSEVLVLVNLEHNLYTTNNYGKIIEFAEYVEYFESNENVQLIEGAEDIEIYSKSNTQYIFLKRGNAFGKSFETFVLSFLFKSNLV